MSASESGGAGAPVESSATDSIALTQGVQDERDLAAAAVALVEQWLVAACEFAVDPSAKRLAEVLADPNGLAFAVGFVDGVMRPEDRRVAGHNLAEVAKLAPASLPASLRAAIRTGGVLGPVIPGVVIPLARRTLRNMVGHLVLDASEARLGAAISQLRSSGNRLNLNLLGEAVLGEREADQRLRGTHEFLARPDVDYVSIKVSSVVSQLSMWNFAGTVERVVTKLTPLYRLAAESPTPKFINLDMEEYRDLDLTIDVFQRLLNQPELQQLTAGIVVQAYLPDALAAVQRLTTWATERVKLGGAPIKIRLVKGANLAMERVDAAIHGWPLATVASKLEADTNYKRVLQWSLSAERTQAVRLGVAGHNLFDIAYAWLLAGDRGVQGAIEFEMLLGMATSQAAAVRQTVGPLRLYTPVVHPAQFDVAIAYLVRRLEENASAENFMSAVFELDTDRELFERERDRFLLAASRLEGHLVAPPINRVQDRAAEAKQLGAELAKPPRLPKTKPAPTDESLTNVVLGFDRGSLTSNATGVIGGPGATPGFHNAPDTDPALAANRAWGTGILERASTSQLGRTLAAKARIDTADELDALLDGVRAAGVEWGTRSADARAAVLHHAGIALAANRARLIEVMMRETAKTLPEADAEVSEAVDFAHYYAERARELDRVQGASFVPSALTVVTPPWNFPVAIPAGGVLAALAAGSGVVLKPAALASRCGALIVELLWEAGVPTQALQLLTLDSRALGQQLIAHPGVDRVILTGSYETAALFRTFRPDLPLLAETSGKNAIVVTPSADLDLAVADVVKSAFGHSGQKCSAASLVILVGSVGRSERFKRQLLDAVGSLRLGPADDPSTQMGPLIEPPSGKLLAGLSTLAAGEAWLVEPRQLGEGGALWSPGVRDWVMPGSEFHLTEYFGPVLGIMRARNLAEAIAWQNQVAYGLTAGLHSLDQHEIEEWLDTVEAGNLYVNRGITGAIVQRQPFGGWKRSAIGAGAKAGGPNYLFGLGEWTRVPPVTGSDSLHLRGLDRRVTEVIESSQPKLSFDDFEQLRQAALSDAVAWRAEYAQTVDHSGLRVERNLLRYRPIAVALRLSDAVSLLDALRAICAALLTRSPFTVSSGIELPRGVRNVLAARGVSMVTENDSAWLSRLSTGGAAALRNLTTDAAELYAADEIEQPSRIRLISAPGDAARLHRAACIALGGVPDIAIWSHPATASGRVELLPYLREQAISITAHRFGNPNPMIADLALH